MAKVTIEIDGEKIEAEEGERLLWAALGAGFYIPHLCAGREMDYHPASCRLCWVEVGGMPAPVTSCTTFVKEGMVVRTRTDDVDRLVRAGFELLMSAHRLECGKCPANKNCALQEAAKKRKLPLKPKRFPKAEPEWPVDDSHPDYVLDPNRCVLCGKCVHVSNEVLGARLLDFKQRGLKTYVGTFNDRPLAELDLADFEKCVEVCPVGALARKKPAQA